MHVDAPWPGWPRQGTAGGEGDVLGRVPEVTVLPADPLGPWLTGPFARLSWFSLCSFKPPARLYHCGLLPRRDPQGQGG